MSTADIISEAASEKRGRPRVFAESFRERVSRTFRVGTGRQRLDISHALAAAKTLGVNEPEYDGRWNWLIDKNATAPTAPTQSTPHVCIRLNPLPHEWSADCCICEQPATVTDVVAFLADESGEANRIACPECVQLLACSTCPECSKLGGDAPSRRQLSQRAIAAGKFDLAGTILLGELAMHVTPEVQEYTRRLEGE